MLKVFLASIVLASGVLMASPSTLAAKNFTDLNSDPSHTKAVTFLNQLNAYDYKAGNLLNGASAVTRAEVSKILYSLYKDKMKVVRTYNDNFKDVNSNTLYSKELIWSYEVGIFDGDTNQKFNPTNHLTRAQMSKILVNTFGLTAHGGWIFYDVPFDHWAFEYISVLAVNGITNGNTQGNYMPNNKVTLNQLSSFIYRIMDKGIQPSSEGIVVEKSASVEEEVLRLVNVERAKEGIPPLAMDWELARVAEYKSQEMHDENYFSHTSPTYGSPFDMMESFGISYQAAAENIAKGAVTAAEVVNLWMNSPGHRANIMDANYTHIGIGHVASSYFNSYWTQMFIAK